MLQQQVYILNMILMAIDCLCIIVSGYGAYYFRVYLSNGRWSMDLGHFVLSVLLVMMLNNYVMAKFNLYSDKKSRSHLVFAWTVFKVIVIDFAFLSTGIFLFKEVSYSRLFLLLFAFLSFSLILIYRLLIHIFFDRMCKNGFNAHKILIVGNKERVEILTRLFEWQVSWGHDVIGWLTTGNEKDESVDCLGTITELPVVLRNRSVDEVVFATDSNRNLDLFSYVGLCKKVGVLARILPALWNPDDNKTLSLEKCQDVPFLTIKVDNFNATGLFYKRILDIVGGLIGTLEFLIMYTVIAVAIKIDSRGPVLFKQQRVGQHGRLFSIYKFRTMHHDAEQRKQELLAKNEMQGAMFKLKDDPRITRVGKWLRKTSIDEFPQFLNVLKGEMSLVGTRPPTPEEVETYMPSHLKRLSAKPGITGLWQISGRNKINDFEKVVELDCRYLNHWRFFDDLKILFKTILVVLQRKGAL